VGSSGYCLPGSLDVSSATTCQSCDDGSANGTGYGLHGLKVSVGGNRKSGFNYVDAQSLKLLGQANFFRPGHTATGRLLSIAQGGVEYLYVLTGWHIHFSGPEKDLFAKSKRAIVSWMMALFGNLEFRCYGCIIRHILRVQAPGHEWPC
jgi:hypothetical protein